MDFDDESDARREIDLGWGPPPGDWAGYRSDQAARSLYIEHRAGLVQYLRGRTARQDIGDLVQDVFRRLLAARGAAPEQPRAYLFAAARNLLVDEQRRAARRSEAAHIGFDDTVHASADPHCALEARDMLRRAEAALARLTPLTREIFLLHRFDGLEYSEIAAAKGISVKGVEKHIAKALVVVRRARSGR